MPFRPGPWLAARYPPRSASRSLLLPSPVRLFSPPSHLCPSSSRYASLGPKSTTCKFDPRRICSNQPIFVVRQTAATGRATRRDVCHRRSRPRQDRLGISRTRRRIRRIRLNRIRVNSHTARRKVWRGLDVAARDARRATGGGFSGGTSRQVHVASATFPVRSRLSVNLIKILL